MQFYWRGPRPSCRAVESPVARIQCRFCRIHNTSGLFQATYRATAPTMLSHEKPSTPAMVMTYDERILCELAQLSHALFAPCSCFMLNADHQLTHCTGMRKSAGCRMQDCRMIVASVALHFRGGRWHSLPALSTNLGTVTMDRCRRHIELTPFFAVVPPRSPRRSTLIATPHPRQGHLTISPPAA